MKSNRTIAEFEAAGLLLGWDYDRFDHTYMKPGVEALFETYHCADTLEQCYFGSRDSKSEFISQWDARKKRVEAGEIGAADYVPKQSKHR